MDYQIDGIDYLILDNTPNHKLTKKKINYNPVEYETLKNWLVFKKHPINQKQIDIFSLKMEYILNQKLYNYKYNDSDEDNQRINLLNIKFSEIQNMEIPENYLRYQKLLDIDYDRV